MNWLRKLLPRQRPRARLRAEGPRRLLVTGSSGIVATLVAPLLRERGHDLRLADRNAAGDAQADLRNVADCDRIVAGVDGIVHLAGMAKERAPEDLLADNSLALANLLRSAARAGVSHFVFASSMHVMGLYRRDEQFDETDEPRPDSYYAASKLHGEALCRLVQEKSGMAVTCLRIGSVTARVEEADPGAWISPEDVVALTELALRLEPPAFEIFHAVADYDGSPLPASRAAQYGYRCLRPAGPYDAALRTAQQWWHGDEWARTRRGASFAASKLDP